VNRNALVTNTLAVKHLLKIKTRTAHFVEMQTHVNLKYCELHSGHTAETTMTVSTHISFICSMFSTGETSQSALTLQNYIRNTITS